MAEGPVTTQQTGREECGETTNEDGAPAKVHTRIAADTLHLTNRRAWRAIGAALTDAGVTNRGVGEAARQVWAERNMLRRAAKAARQIAHQPNMATSPTHQNRSTGLTRRPRWMQT